MKHKNKRVSAEDLDEVIASHFGNFDTVEADEDEDLEGDDEEMLEDEEDILDDAEGDEDSEDEDSDESEDDEDFEGDDEEEEVTDEDEEDFEGDDEGDDDEADADDEFEGEGDDEEEDFLDVDGEDEDSEDDEEDFDAEADEDFDAEADEDEDFEDIDAVIASAEDPIEALIACGAVAVIMPTASHDFHEVKAAFDGLDEEFEADASDDEDFEDADEDFEADADEDSDDEDFEVEADDDESCDDDDEVLEDDEEEEIDDEADASEDDEDDDFEADASDDEDSDESEDEDSENFHPVADMEMLAEASAEDVELVLYAQGSDAWWNVIVAGLPAARISKESLSPEVHAFFVQDQFASNVKETIASEGLLPVLENMHAEFYATAFLNSELADEIRSEVEATASEDVTERAANLREDFLKAVNLASAGCNKNYWPKLGSPLKAALFEELAEAGVSNAAEIIENAFAKGGDAHFDAVTSKAVEIMDKSPEYREELEEAIAEAGVISHASDESDEEEIEESSNTATASFMQKLVHGSFGNKSSKGSLGDRLRNGLGR